MPFATEFNNTIADLKVDDIFVTKADPDVRRTVDSISFEIGRIVITDGSNDRTAHYPGEKIAIISRHA